MYKVKIKKEWNYHTGNANKQKYFYSHIPGIESSKKEKYTYLDIVLYIKTNVSSIDPRIGNIFYPSFEFTEKLPHFLWSCFFANRYERDNP